MIEMLATFILGGAAMWSGVFAYSRIQYWKGQYEATMEETEKILDRALEAEKTSQIMFDKYTAKNDLINQVLKRPVVAALTDDHVQAISSTLASLVIQNLGPNRLN